MKTNLPVKTDIDEFQLKELEKKEKLKQIADAINKKDTKFVNALKQFINK